MRPWFQDCKVSLAAVHNLCTACSDGCAWRALHVQTMDNAEDHVGFVDVRYGAPELDESANS